MFCKVNCQLCLFKFYFLFIGLQVISRKCLDDEDTAMVVAMDMDMNMDMDMVAMVVDMDMVAKVVDMDRGPNAGAGASASKATSIETVTRRGRTVMGPPAAPAAAAAAAVIPTR